MYSLDFITATELKRLRLIQNTAARIVTRTWKTEHITPVLNCTGCQCNSELTIKSCF